MPYCPKCDMEFIDGITVCSDCGGPLAASKEEAMKMKKQMQEEEVARMAAEYEAARGMLNSIEGAEPQQAPEPAPVKVYVKKADKYEDLKSSASAFILVGACLLLFSVLCWTGIISLPVAGTSKLLMQAVLTVMGIGSLAVAFNALKSAKVVKSQIAEENTATRQLIEWFITSHSAADLDRQLSAELGELGPEELSLKRFELIQDILITNHDITDQSYVDSLSEEIYSKLFE